MAIRTFAELKAHFKAGKTATVAAWTDVIDTIEWIEGRLAAALAAASPVLIVADEAARLALGPTLVVGQMVKQTDDGVTYSLQEAPGSLAGQWVAVGDVQIAISDVLNLQTQLDRRLIDDGDNVSLRLGMRQMLARELPLLTASPDIVFPVNGPWMSYAETPGDVTITLDAPMIVGNASYVASLFLFNPQLTSSVVTLPMLAFSPHVGNVFDLGSQKLAIITFLHSLTPTAMTPTTWIFTRIET